MKNTVDLKRKTERVKSLQKWWETLPFEKSNKPFDRSESLRLVSRSLEEDFPFQEGVEERKVSAPKELQTQDLPVLFSLESDEPQNVVLQTLLGEGGMGEVWLGHQQTLHRDVAVKVIKPEIRNAKARTKLLREAWVTGFLEHPNIIPVHVLGVDAEGSPAFAMKRVQGVSWEDLIFEKVSLPDTLPGANKLEKHLRILKQVCNALRFSHSVGIIHRDIKPSNVMVGSFGEVYVMDWGIAASLREEHKGWLPLAFEEEGIFGTPAYMAPEMAAGSRLEMSEAVDIYLLGATLHELLTGEAPHFGETLLEVLTAAVQSSPKSYPPSVPSELAAICQRAMASEPTERFPSVEAFQHAIAEFMQHRDSRQLSLETSLSLVQLKALLREKDDSTELYQLFGQVRFGYQHALRAWEGNAQARQGLQEALELMIEHELENNHSQAALALLSELPEPRPELEEAVESLHRLKVSSQADIKALQQMLHDTDLSVEAAARSRLMVWMAILLGLVPLLAELAHDWKWLQLSPQADFVLSSLTVVASLGCLWLWRKTLWPHKINQNVLMALGLTLAALFLLWSLGLRLGLAFPQLLALESIPLFGFFAFIAVVIDRRLLPVLGLYCLVPLSALFFPNLSPYTTSLGNMAAFVLFGWIWKQPVKSSHEAKA